MVHYSSNTQSYEGGAKNPLKGTSLKFLVYARVAKLVCFQGVKILGTFVMAYKLDTLESLRLNYSFLSITLC